MSRHTVVGRVSLVVLILFGAAMADRHEVWPPTAAIFETTAADAYVRATAFAGAPATSGLFVVAAAPDQFERWIRYPAEERRIVAMDPTHPVGYFRDLYTGGETLHTGGIDGETLNAEITPPGAPPLTFVGFRFDGTKHCWVPNTINGDCIGAPGNTALRVDWLHASQCGATGEWKLEFFRNGASTLVRTFHLSPTINPDKVAFIEAPAYNQGHYRDAQYGNICRDPVDGEDKTCSLITTPNPPVATIGRLGCLLTGYAAALTYYGIPTLPTDLNDYLRDHDGFSQKGAIFGQAVARYAWTVQPALRLAFLRRDKSNSSGALPNGLARDAVCRSGPTPLPVTHHDSTGGRLIGHFVTAWGRPDTEDDYLLKDPAGGVDGLLSSVAIPHDYRGVYAGTRELRSAASTYQFPGSLTIAIGSPAELLLTDPSGRRTGVNPTSGTTYAENPDATYADDSIGPSPNDPDPTGKGIVSKSIELSPVSPGTYSLQVIGTAVGTYILEFHYEGADYKGMAKAEVLNVPTAAGVVHTYEFTAPIVPNQSLPLHGSFDGGGQRPRDVNKFLSYSTVGGSRTDLPAGSSSYPLLVFYDSVVVADSFLATLNGVPITTSFHPSPGAYELVTIPLTRGTNTLQLSIDGQLANRTATDTDRLTFRVP